MPEEEAVREAQPRLVKLIVKNFRAIGANPVEIDLDDIVILVGPNNTGKSSILRAYETIMNDGSSGVELTLDDFPSGRVDPDSLPEIELHTVVTEDAPGDEWCSPLNDGEKLVKEKWVWEKPGKPVRTGFNVELGRWAQGEDAEKVPWGAASVANARRPQPHRVNAFDPPDEQTNEVLRLLDTVLSERLKAHKEGGEESEFGKLVKAVEDLQKAVVEDSRAEIGSLQDSLSELVGKVFPRHKVVFDPQPEEKVEDSFRFFTAQSQLRMGPEDGYLSTIDKQGSGARRTLLWTALKLLADQGVKARPAASKSKKAIKVDPKRPHLLLIDEPEICLHPSAVREASDLLYGLPRLGHWQVMVTTHSPCFVDFTRDNTTIVRVSHTEEGAVSGTTIFRPATASLDEDDQRRLKLLNLCDPYMAEFFFGGRSIVVEGDTEHTAFAYVRESAPDEFQGAHIIRARGKSTIVSLMKILNHFGTPYSVLHDSDTKRAQRRDGTVIANPAWTKNFDILGEAQKAEAEVRVVALVPNFEEVFFGEEAKGAKPYNALSRLREGDDVRGSVEQLFRALMGEEEELPEGAVHVMSKEDLEALGV